MVSNALSIFMKPCKISFQLFWKIFCGTIIILTPEVSDQVELLFLCKELCLTVDGEVRNLEFLFGFAKDLLFEVVL